MRRLFLMLVAFWSVACSQSPVASTDVTDAGLACLQQMPGLWGIRVDVAQFSDLGVSNLQSKNMGSIEVGTCSEKRKIALLQRGVKFPEQIDDQVVARISQLKSLWGVQLTGNSPDEPAALTGVAVKSLASLPKLTDLLITDLRVDPAVLQQIRKEMPRLRVLLNGKR